MTESERDQALDTDQFAVITGASTGIGLELAKLFAQHNYQLLLVADDSALDDAVRTVGGNGNEVQGVRTDLSTPDGVAEVIAAIGERRVDALALNAGIGNAGRFVEIPWADEQRLIGLNVSSTVQLAKYVVPDMVRRKAGRVLITSSVAARMPGPYYATYAASKAFVLSFAEALRYEVKDEGVTVTALMPGPTDTEFFDRADMDAPIVEAKKDDPAEVARDGFEAMLAGKDHVVSHSAKNKVQMAGSRLMTEPQKAAVHAKMTKPEDG